MKKPGNLCVAEDRVWIEPGKYKAYCFKSEYGLSFGGGKKLYVGFRLVEGIYKNAELVMYCTRPRGTLKPTHKIYKQWCLAIGKKPKVGEAFRKEIFVDKTYLVTVADTIPKFSDGTDFPDFMKYSKVDSIIEPVTNELKEEKTSDDSLYS